MTSTTHGPKLSIDDLQAALDRCMKAHPPAGQELRLHPDASRLADLFAPMILGRLQSVLLTDVDPRVAAAVCTSKFDAHRRTGLS